MFDIFLKKYFQLEVRSSCRKSKLIMEYLEVLQENFNIGSIGLQQKRPLKKISKLMDNGYRLKMMISWLFEANKKFGQTA